MYVPDNVAPRPALPVLVHFCGGSAGAIFNGNGHDFATAADWYGYLVVVPEATRDGHCFDVSAKAGLTRDGGSDSTGIMSMAGWARQHYSVDPAHIVVSGFSSGAVRDKRSTAGLGTLPPGWVDRWEAGLFPKASIRWRRTVGTSAVRTAGLSGPSRRPGRGRSSSRKGTSCVQVAGVRRRGPRRGIAREVLLGRLKASVPG